MRPFALIFSVLGANILLGACTPSPAQIAEERRQEQQVQAQQHAAAEQQAHQAQIKEQADTAWAAVEDAEHDYPPEGGDYHHHNLEVTTAYHRWEALQLAAYGSNWRQIWHDSHRGDDSDCSQNEDLGMPVSACEQAAASQGDIEPLEPMLFKCRSGGAVIPTDAESCRTHGARTMAETPEGRAAAEATWETPEAQQMLADTAALDAKHARQREKRRDKALKALGVE